MEGACARPSGAWMAENDAGNGETAEPRQSQAALVWCQPRLTVQLTDTPSPLTAAPPPVSCPSRFQLSPARHDGAAFDPFAPPEADGEELPGCTPQCAQQAGAQLAPPAVHRKCVAGSPVPAPAAALLPANRVQSCPPERVGRRAARPLHRIRVKRSLNGAVAAAAGSGGGALARRSLDVGVPAAPQVAGCSRKRFEADMLSPPLPRKSSRTLLDDQQAADLLARLQLAPHAGGSGVDCSAQAAPSLMPWAAAEAALYAVPPG